MIMCAVGRNGRRIPDPEVQWTRGRFSAMEAFPGWLSCNAPTGPRREA